MLVGIPVGRGEIGAGEGNVAELFAPIEVGGEAQTGGGIIIRDIEISECGGIGRRRIRQTNDVIGVGAVAGGNGYEIGGCGIRCGIRAVGSSREKRSSVHHPAWRSESHLRCRSQQ